MPLTNLLPHVADLLLSKEPENLQAQSLNELIDRAVTKGKAVTHVQPDHTADCLIEGYIGMALVGGAAAVGTLLLAGLVRRGRK